MPLNAQYTIYATKGLSIQSLQNKRCKLRGITLNHHNHYRIASEFVTSCVIKTHLFAFFMSFNAVWIRFFSLIFRHECNRENLVRWCSIRARKSELEGGWGGVLHKVLNLHDVHNLTKLILTQNSSFNQAVLLPKPYHEL